mmetsp:Transcript_5928/g.6049  ORF Transcript_5928/g.6049 Transcript_5928/m.6049 type:complete len:139 (+) Transcript_5928:100-516(+)
MSMKMINANKYPLLIAFFSLLALSLAIAIGVTCQSYPLFPFKVNDLEWSKNWLIATVIDYYGAATCLCVIALLSEPALYMGIIWSIGFLLLGSPICCLYCIYRLVFKSLALKDEGYKELNSTQGIVSPLYSNEMNSQI